MAKSLIAVAVLLLVAGAAFVFRSPSPSSVAAPGTGPNAFERASSPSASPLGEDAGAPETQAAAPAGLPATAAAASPNFTPSAADRGGAGTAPATTTYVGPDGMTHDIPPASADLVALGDDNLRAAVMDEIRADPEAFAKAMHIELEDVQRVANGEAELPPHWIVK